jgi:hypothetical protein
MRKIVIPGLLLMMTGLLLAQVHAQTSDWPPPEGSACKPTPAEKEQAKMLSGLGHTAYTQFNYAEAIRYMRDAYAHDCTQHDFLRILGQLYATDKQFANAIQSYKWFVARAKPTGADLDDINQKLAALEKWSSEPAASASTSTSTTATAASAPPSASASASAAPSSAPSTAPTTTTVSSGGSFNWVPVIPVGVGVVLVVVGAVLAGSANSDINSLSNQWVADGCTKPGLTPSQISTCNQVFGPSLQSKANSDITKRGVGWAMVGVGGAAIVGGVIWWIVKPTIGESAASKVSVTSGPGDVGFGLKFSF